MRLTRVGDDGTGAAALEAVDEVARPGRRGRGHEHRTELHDAEHGVPQLDLVAEHEQHGIASPNAEAGEPGRHLVGTTAHQVERDGGDRLVGRATVIDDRQGGAVVAAGEGIEPVDRPVEPRPHIGEGELADGALVLTPQLE